MNEVNHLVISSTLDYSTDLICAEFEKRRVSYLRLNRDIFEDYEIIYNLQSDAYKIKLDDTLYTLNSKFIKSIYFRAPVFLRTTGKARSVTDQLKRSQWSSFLRNLIVLDDARWMNHPVSTYKAENKLYQLKIAKACGLEVPETFVGNSLPSNIKSNKIYIIKSLDTALFYKDGNEMFTYSTMIKGRELLTSEIKLAPIILQEYLSPKLDLRVTYVKGDMFPVAIMNQGKMIDGDWRKSNKDYLSYTPIELPKLVKNQLILLMNRLNLTFGGIDLALVGDKFYFIEVNPTGEWGWLTTCADLPIDKAIVNTLIN